MNLPTKKKLVFSSIAILLPLLSVMLLLELSLQVWYYFHHKVDPPLSYRMPEIGWKSSESLNAEFDFKHYEKIKYTTNEQGFRRFDSPRAGKPTILVVGDSFTQAYHVSDGKAYFDYFANAAQQPAVIAYGAGGYSTAQEYLTLKRLIPSITPDLIVWQFTGNDFINNDYELERLSTLNSSHMYRPFFVDDKFVVKHPDGFGGWLAEYSYLFRRLMVVKSSIKKRLSGTVEDSLGMSSPMLQRSIANAAHLFNDLQQQYPNIPIVSFFAGRFYFPWEQPAYQQLCEQIQVSCIRAVHQTLQNAAAEGEKVDGGRDGHWNERGHQIAGELLSEEIQRIFLSNDR